MRSSGRPSNEGQPTPECTTTHRTPMRNADYQYRLPDRSVNPYWVTFQIQEIEAGDWRSLPRSPYWPAPISTQALSSLAERAGNRMNVWCCPVAARRHAPVNAVCNGEQCHRNEGTEGNPSLGTELHTRTVAPSRYRGIRKGLPLRIDVIRVPIQSDSQPSTVSVLSPH